MKFLASVPSKHIPSDADLMLFEHEVDRLLEAAGMSEAVLEKTQILNEGFTGSVRVVSTDFKDSASLGFLFLVKFEIDETNMPLEHPQGSRIYWVVKMKNKVKEAAYIHIRQWIRACAGGGPIPKGKDLSKFMIDAVENPRDNDFVGCLVGVKTTRLVDRVRYDFFAKENVVHEKRLDLRP